MSQVYRPCQEWHEIAQTHLGTPLNSTWCAINHMPTLDTYSVMFEGYFQLTFSLQTATILNADCTCFNRYIILNIPYYVNIILD